MMKPFSLFLFINIILGSFTIFGCKEENNELRKQAYTSNFLNIDGYYFVNEKGENEGLTSILIFYRDGVLYNGGSKATRNLNEIDQYIRDHILPFSKADVKYVWGVFEINNGLIKIEQWWPSTGGPTNTLISKGEILDTATFMINEVYSNYEKETYLVSDTFHFRPFSPKPDSTNNFIR